MSHPVEPAQQQFVSAAAVGEALGRSPGTVRRWTRLNYIPYARISLSGSYEYDLDEVRRVTDDTMRVIRRPAGTR